MTLTTALGMRPGDGPASSINETDVLSAAMALAYNACQGGVLRGP